MQLKTIIFNQFLCAALLVLLGCTARGTLAPASSSTEAAASALSFNEQAGALPEGVTQYFADSPFGPAVIEVGPLYLSGLGDECRSARAAAGAMRRVFAVCREENGAWRFIPTIFESMSR